MKTTRAFIFARGGSKGIKNKNLLPINGTSLVGHSVLLAKGLNEVEKVYVSTDSNQIEKEALMHGADVIKRPIELATDEAPEWLAWQHAIKQATNKDGAFDIFLSLPPTSPLREPSDVRNCLNALTRKWDIVLTATNAQRNPWFNMVTIDSLGFTKLVCGDSSIARRQDAPHCFDLTTVAYVAKPDFILSAKSIWEGKVTTVNVPYERCIDIDNPMDFAIARFLMENPTNYGDFEI
tara:strand:+ start:984 stop:1691 length:708 start_codon:yes stop_codon:yes gene_type:complete